MNEREELTELLAKHIDCAFSASGVLVCQCGVAMQPNEPQWDMANLAAHQADTLTAAGYRRPRTITTVEELDALPDGAVIRDNSGTVRERFNDDETGAALWVRPGAKAWMLSRNFSLLPATVLHEPEATK